jgi:hypothetical protein
VRRWRRRSEGRTLDVSLEMTRVTLDVLERTIFTHGLASDPDALGRAITAISRRLADRPARPVRRTGLGAADRALAGTPGHPLFEEVVGELIAAAAR